MSDSEKMESINCEFQFGQRVKIIYGFYKDRVASIKSTFTKEVNIIQNNKPSKALEVWYNLELIINDRKVYIELAEQHLELYKLRPFWSRKK